MATINIGIPTYENMDRAMTSIGFTKTDKDGHSKYTWDNDPKKYMYLEFQYNPGATYSQVTAFNKFPGGGDSQVNYINQYSSLAWKLNYEELVGGGIILGFSTDSGVHYHFAFVAPKSASDDWIGMAIGATIVDYSVPKAIEYILGGDPYFSNMGGKISPYSDDIQMIQLYNEQRFLDNLYLTLLAPVINPYTIVRATVGDMIYLIWNSTSTASHGGTCFALELPA